MPNDLRSKGPAVEESLAHLHRAGWSIGDTATTGEGGGVVWIVSGSTVGTSYAPKERPRPSFGIAPWCRARAVGMLERPVGLVGPRRGSRRPQPAPSLTGSIHTGLIPKSGDKEIAVS